MEPTWTLDGCYRSDDIYFTLGPYSYLSYAWGFRPLGSLPHPPSTGVLWDNPLLAVIALPAMPSANLCSVPPFHALEVLANVVAAATPPHPFVTVGQSCMGCSRLGIAEGGPPGRCSCYMGSIVSVPCFCLAGLYWFELIWVCAPLVQGPSVSGSYVLGLPDLSRALHVCLYKPRCPVVRSPFGDGSRVGIHFPLALPVGGGVWISSADVEVSTDVS